MIIQNIPVGIKLREAQNYVPKDIQKKKNFTLFKGLWGYIPSYKLQENLQDV